MLTKNSNKCYNIYGCGFMNYTVKIDEFEGPLDLLLHLIKQSNISIYDISIEEITKQYMDYINQMEILNLTVASEYLIMAAELIEIKSSSLLPRKEENEDDYEENKKDKLISRLLEYEQYKKISESLKQLELSRKDIYTKFPSELEQFKTEKVVEKGSDLSVLLDAFNEFLKRKEEEKPLNTKITNKEYSVDVRNKEIKELLKLKKKVNFYDLFEINTREYIVVTFLSILDLAKKQEIKIIQDNNFNNIVLTIREGEE